MSLRVPWLLEHRNLPGLKQLIIVQQRNEAQDNSTSEVPYSLILLLISSHVLGCWVHCAQWNEVTLLLSTVRVNPGRGWLLTPTGAGGAE